MMTQQIDFYILKSIEKRSAYSVICRIIQKAYAEQQSVCILVESAQDMQQLDDQLWTFNDISFIPHHADKKHHCVWVTPALVADPTVQQPQNIDVIINFTSKLPDINLKTSRIIEIVLNEEQVKQASREKYKLYRDQGHQLQTYQL